MSFAEVAALGAAGLPVVGAAITAGLASVIWLNARMGLPPRLGLLTAAGTSICGVTAITALAPAIQVRPNFSTLPAPSFPHCLSYLPTLPVNTSPPPPALTFPHCSHLPTPCP